jgi:hypothetical protein
VFPSARATLSDPGKPSPSLPLTDGAVLGSDSTTSSPLAVELFEVELLKPDAGPACGSRFSVDTLLDDRSFRWNHKSTGCPAVKQSSVLGGWLDLSILCFHFEF